MAKKISNDKTLYKPQVEAHKALYAFWAAQEPIFGLVSPTGSGKSTVIRSLAAHLEQETPTGRRACLGVHCVYPLVHIGDGFRGVGSLKVGRNVYKTGEKTWLSEYNTYYEGALASILGSRKRYKPGFATLCSYQLMHNAVAKAKKEGKLNLKGRLLVVDEGHHAGAEMLGSLVKMWQEAGGCVCIVTATPSRTDGIEVLKPTDPQFIRTLAQHAMDTDRQGRTLVPRRMWMNAQRLPGYRVTTTDEMTGRVCSENIHPQAARSITDQWEQDGRPKLIVRVPGRGSKKWADKLSRRFKKLGARVHNAVGVGTDYQTAFRELLERENTATKFSDSEIDIIIACKRFDEGTDWPIASHIYVIGFPRSVGPTIQKWGRTFRPKHRFAGHTHPEDAVIVFFSPTPKGLNEDIMRLHEQAALLTACHLADYQTGQAYARRAGITNVIQSAIKAIFGFEKAAKMAGQAMSTDEHRVTARKRIEETIALEPGLTFTEVAKRVMERSKGPEKLAVARVLFENLGETELTLGEARKLKNAVVKALKALVGSKPESKSKSKGPKSGRLAVSGDVELIADALLEAFNEVLEDYKDIEVTSNGFIMEMAGMFTGKSQKQVAQDLKDRLRTRNTSRTFESCKAEIQVFFDKHGRRPILSEHLNLNAYLRNHCESSLNKLCDEMGLPGGYNMARSIDDAKEAFQVFFDEHGRRPQYKEIVNIAAWLHGQGTTFSKVCDELGLPGGPVVYTMDGAKETIQAFFDEHGRRPAQEETGGLNDWLRKNGSTVNRICSELSLPGGRRMSRTMDGVRKEVQAFFDKHGKRPSENQLGASINWLRLQGTSLRDLCNDMGLPQKLNWTRTVENIQEDLQAHFDEHGRRPTEGDFAGHDGWLRTQHGLTVSMLCDKMGLPQLRNNTRTLETCKVEIQAYFDEHGKRPPGKEFTTINSWISRNTEFTLKTLCDKLGFPGGGSGNRA